LCLSPCFVRGETKHGDKHKELARESMRNKYRVAHGMDPEMPPMTKAECLVIARASKVTKAKE
jgi:hypothetical protein